ncbi:MAG: DUF3892 domain-containing protein [Pseudomonadota bacterium]
MSVYDSLKAVWKKLGIKGQVVNYSSKELWVLETESGQPVARKLLPGYKTTPSIDVDGFKRVDGVAIDGHRQWWKFYDFSTVEIFDFKNSLLVSAITKVAVDEIHFGQVSYRNEKWGEPIRAIIDVRRDKKRNIVEYCINSIGWVKFDTAFKMTCYHEIANARPVFPSGGKPYIRTRRDDKIINNLSSKG